jgi:hypothetical protein
MRNLAVVEGWPRRAVRRGRVEPFDPRRNDEAGLRLLELVAADRGVSARLILHRSRCEADVALARQVAMYLMHVGLGRIYSEVGRFFDRDRTTVSHACALIEDMRDDFIFDAEVERLEALLREPEMDDEELRHAAR